MKGMQPETINTLIHQKVTVSNMHIICKTLISTIMMGNTLILTDWFTFNCGGDGLM